MVLKAVGPMAGAAGSEDFALSRQGSNGLLRTSTYSMEPPTYCKPHLVMNEQLEIHNSSHLKPHTPGDSWHSETSATDVMLSPNSSRRHHWLGKASRNQLLAMLVAGPGKHPQPLKETRHVPEQLPCRSLGVQYQAAMRHLQKLLMAQV